MGLDEIEAAFAGLARQVWEEIDRAMEPLWATDDERRRLAASCDIGSLLEAEPIERDGVCRLHLDVESDMAAESLSRVVDAPFLAASRFGQEWLRLDLFEQGRNRGWLFWASAAWIDGHENAAEPALATAARASGGWLGDHEPFEMLLAVRYSRSDLKRLLDADIREAADFADQFYQLVGAPELI